MTKVLKLSLIGPLVITQDDLPLDDLTTAKAQALLCYLAVAARAVFPSGARWFVVG